MKADLANEYLQAYSELRQIFAEEAGYDLYVIGGSLLGPTRDGDLLKNDKDMDLGYLSDFTDACAVREELVDIILRLAHRYPNVELVREEWTAVRTHFRWRKSERVRIDVMPAWFGVFNEVTHYCRPTFVGFPANQKMILPLKESKLRGVSVLFPARSAEKLAGVYGQGWQVPNPDFDKNSTRSIVAKREVRRLRFSWKQQFAMIRATKQAAKFSCLDLLWVWLATQLWVKGLWRIARLRPANDKHEHLL